MAQTVADLMTPNPVTLPVGAPLRRAAEAMRSQDIGAVIVVEEPNHVRGIVTDRDLVVRGLALGLDPDEAKLREVCSQELTVLRPEDPIDRAVSLARARAVRRFPVVEDGEPIGILTIGDLAVERDPE